MVQAFSASSHLKRTRLIHDTVAAQLRFPSGRVASFTCSFGSAPVASLEVIGTRGTLRLHDPFDWATPKALEWTVHGRTRRKRFKKSGQFAAELCYFSDCVLSGKHPEPDGHEGLADVRIIEAIGRSIETGRSVALEKYRITRRPSKDQEIDFPPAQERRLIRAKNPIDKKAA